MDSIKVGIVGSGFIADLHAAAFQMVPDAELVAVASPTPGKATHFARERGIPNAFEDHRQLLAIKDIRLVTLCVPNYLHCAITLDAAKAGKHVVCEKPLCMTLEEADQMIDACKKAGVLLMYAEELCFAPKYVRSKKLVEGGALGKPKVKSVQATMGTYVHADKTRGEDHSHCIVEYEGGMVGLAENSWAKHGGVDDRCEIYGSGGFTRADLLRGSSLLTYSEKGYGYAVEKAATTQGYTFTMFEEIWNYGFPQELQHFVRCVQGKESPLETGEDGREVLKIIYAAYESAGTGRRIDWPYTPRKVGKPIDLWLQS